MNGSYAKERSRAWLSQQYDEGFMLTVDLLVLGLPVTRRLGVTKRGGLYVTSDYRQYKEQMTKMYRDTILYSIPDFPLELRPASYGVSLFLWAAPHTRIDLDNALKPIIDAAGALFGLDDTIERCVTVAAQYYGVRRMTDEGEEIDAHSVNLRAYYPNIPDLYPLCQDVIPF